ncbi:MAG: HEAT repeat domain-containing protein [Planctomycetes bacterium]|nr:HEAT repeat domain-containing protein [Planctomycetota bacterium]
MNSTRSRLGFPSVKHGVCGSLLVSAVAWLVLSLSSTASARVHVGVGIGVVSGPRYCYPSYRYYSCGPWWPSYYWYDPWWDPWPVYVGPPVIVERPVVRERVIVREHRPPAPAKEPAPDLISEKLQQKRSESIRKLRIGDPASRVQAVRELEQFAGGLKVRTALEQALLSDRDPQVRKTVAELFGRVQDKKTLAALKQAHAEDSDRDVRQAAYRAILLIEGY